MTYDPDIHGWEEDEESSIRDHDDTTWLAAAISGALLYGIAIGFVLGFALGLYGPFGG